MKIENNYLQDQQAPLEWGLHHRRPRRAQERERVVLESSCCERRYFPKVSRTESKGLSDEIMSGAIGFLAYPSNSRKLFAEPKWQVTSGTTKLSLTKRNKWEIIDFHERTPSHSSLHDNCCGRNGPLKVAAAAALKPLKPLS